MSSVDLFISHSSKDIKVVSALTELLRDALNIPAGNVRCTSDKRYGLEGGDKIDERLRDEIARAKTFVTLITDASVKSLYVLLEVGARWGTGRGFIPLLASGAGPDLVGDPIKGYHSLSCDDESDLYRLVKDVARGLGAEANDAGSYARLVARLKRASKREAKLRSKIVLSAPLTDYKTSPNAGGEGKDDFDNLKYVDHIAERGELDRLHQFCSEIIPDGWASLDRWRERYDKNPKTFHMVKAVRTNGFESTEKLVGSFALTPITEEAVALLEKEELAGVGFTESHVAAPGERPAALYLSGIAAADAAKGYTELLLSWKLQQEAEEGNRLVYTRPHTGDGMRLVKKYEFSPVNPSVTYDNGRDRIFKKEIN